MDERLKSLRAELKRRGVEACLITGFDPHLSEYVSPYYQTRKWISGFTGSAGRVVVTRDHAALFTDFRYWIQAGEELDHECMELVKEGFPGAPQLDQWVAAHLEPGESIGVNGWELSIKDASMLTGLLARFDIGLTEIGDFIEPLWEHRDALTADPIVDHPVQFSGINRTEKLKAIRRVMNIRKLDYYLLSSLDDIAWLLNLRGSDIPFNPVARSYVLLEKSKATVFLDRERLDTSLSDALKQADYSLEDYEGIIPAVDKLKKGRLLLDPDKSPWIFVHYLNPDIQLDQQNQIIPVAKAVKNNIEIQGFKDVMPRDGLAMVRFQIWLQKQLEAGSITEEDAAREISRLRSQNREYKGDSFAPISAFGPNAAMCHYESSPDRPVPLEEGSLYLLDSGGQYLSATTDITRTYALGQVDASARRDYTLVLKGHLALSMQRFPRGTRGYQLDSLARKALWDQGLDYGHGTGHGIGAYLNVHEGPQSISHRPVEQALLPGMIISNEPGLYLEGKYGIRIENLVLVTEDEESKGAFLRMETLTLCPYERELIDISLLTQEEIQWIDTYHQKVWESLKDLLDDKEQEWLKKRCVSLY